MRSLTVISALLLGPATLAGQEPIVAAGTRVELTTKAIEKVSVARGWRPDPLGGAVKGMVIGGAAGLAVFTALCGEADIDPGPGEGGPGACSWSDAGFLLMGTGALAVAGGVVGLVAGTIVGTHRWQQVAMPVENLSLRPLGGGGVGVGFSLRF